MEYCTICEDLIEEKPEYEWYKYPVCKYCVDEYESKFDIEILQTLCELLESYAENVVIEHSENGYFMHITWYVPEYLQAKIEAILDVTGWNIEVDEDNKLTIRNIKIFDDYALLKGDI